MLTLQLRELEEDGLLTGTVSAEMPPRVEYELGHALKPMMVDLRAWGERHTRSTTQRRV